MCGWCCGGVPVEKRGAGHHACAEECHNATPRPRPSTRAIERAAAAKALREAAAEQERLSTSPRALGSKAVEFKRLLFAQWLRDRADQIEQEQP